MGMCVICNKTTKTKYSLSNHIRTHNITSKQYYDRYLRKENEGYCLVCKKETTFKSILMGYAKYCFCCSSRCSEIKEKRIITCLKKYGATSPTKSNIVRQKTINTCMRKYGVSNVYQNKEIQNRYKETCLKIHGCDNPFSLQEVKDKIRETNVKKYGTPSALQNDQIKKKHEKTCFKNFGVLNPSQSQLVKEKKKQTYLKNWGVDHFTKSDIGRTICRITAIRRIEEQQQNKEPLSPAVGKKERPFLNELQNYTNYNIIRQDSSFRYYVGRFPDGHISQLKLFIQFDERDHFLDRECKQYKEDDIQCTLELASCGYLVYRVSEKIWKEDKDMIIHQFRNMIMELE